MPRSSAKRKGEDRIIPPERASCAGRRRTGRRSTRYVNPYLLVIVWRLLIYVQLAFIATSEVNVIFQFCAQRPAYLVEDKRFDDDDQAGRRHLSRQLGEHRPSCQAEDHTLGIHKPVPKQRKWRYTSSSNYCPRDAYLGSSYTDTARDGSQDAVRKNALKRCSNGRMTLQSKRLVKLNPMKLGTTDVRTNICAVRYTANDHFHGRLPVNTPHSKSTVVKNSHLRQAAVRVAENVEKDTIEDVDDFDKMD
ncbi:hypothetical protein EDB85DRAFT_1896853 [Lactarius pseudohatsudake]|nr:hypothetical protein EDB85DRAFT_1896853 [Lactarius pseudohatsudake]